MPDRLRPSPLFAVLRATDADDPVFCPDGVAERINDLYSELPDVPRVVARRDLSGRNVLVSAALPDRATAVSYVAYGVAVGSAGRATPDEIDAAFDRPDTAARSLLGAWVAVAERPSSLELLTSSDLCRTLVHAGNGKAQAWSTKGLMALAAIDAAPELVVERVPEHCYLDYVLGDDELVCGTSTLDEAAQLSLTRDRVVVSSYWPFEERFAADGPPTGATDLRAQLGSDLVRMARVPEMRLGLTAGRDSVLVASCLLEQGARIPTFTIGGPGYPDFDGARAVATAWDVDHRPMTDVAEPDDLGPGPQWERAVRRSAWSEGLDTAWNLVNVGLTWDGPDFIWLAGSGAEVGRAFYWSGARTERKPSLDELASQVLHDMGGVAWPYPEATQERLREAIARCTAVLPGWQGLDLFYATGRVRKWMGRTQPRPEIVGQLGAYTSPAVVDVLLRLPDADKQTGRVFDAALDACPAGLRSLALTAARTTTRSQPPRLVRLAARTASRLRPARPAVDTTLATVLAQANHQAAAGSALPPTWWAAALPQTKHHPRLRQAAWNALSVDAFRTHCGR